MEVDSQGNTTPQQTVMTLGDGEVESRGDVEQDQGEEEEEEEEEKEAGNLRYHELCIKLKKSLVSNIPFLWCFNLC